MTIAERIKSYFVDTYTCSMCLNRESSPGKNMIRVRLSEPITDGDIILIPAGHQFMHRNCAIECGVKKLEEK